MKDRFKTELVDGDFIGYIENDGDKVCIAYVSVLPGEKMCRFSRCYSESWLVPGEEPIQCPGDVRNLWTTRETYTLEELNINPWTIVALKNINPLKLEYGKIW
jgi:hypothetical protein